MKPRAVDVADEERREKWKVVLREVIDDDLKHGLTWRQFSVGQYCTFAPRAAAITSEDAAEREDDWGREMEELCTVHQEWSVVLDQVLDEYGFYVSTFLEMCPVIYGVDYSRRLPTSAVSRKAD